MMGCSPSLAGGLISACRQHSTRRGHRYLRGGEGGGKLTAAVTLSCHGKSETIAFHSPTHLQTAARGPRGASPSPAPESRPSLRWPGALLRRAKALLCSVLFSMDFETIFQKMT